MRIPRSLPIIVAVLLAAGAVSACASKAEPAVTTSSTTAGISPATAGTSSTTTVTEGPATPADGTYFGFVHAVSADGTLVFDPAEWFSGDAATAAARADGFIGTDEDLSDPFYVRNPTIKQLRLEIDPGAQFILLVAPDTPEQSELVEKTLSLQELGRLSSGMVGGDTYYSWFPQNVLPMDVTVSGGRVTGGKEHYMP